MSRCALEGMARTLLRLASYQERRLHQHRLLDVASVGFLSLGNQQQAASLQVVREFHVSCEQSQAAQPAPQEHPIRVAPRPRIYAAPYSEPAYADRGAATSEAQRPALQALDQVAAQLEQTQTQPQNTRASDAQTLAAHSTTVAAEAGGPAQEPAADTAPQPGHDPAQPQGPVERTVEEMLFQYQRDWSRINPLALEPLNGTLREIFEKQLRQEFRAQEYSKVRREDQLRDAARRGDLTGRKRVETLAADWTDQLTLALQQEMSHARALKSKKEATEVQYSVLWPTLARLGTQTVAETTVGIVLKDVLKARRKMSYVSLCSNIGKALEDDLRWLALKDQLNGRQEDELGRERLETLMQMFDKAADKARGVYRRRSEVARRHADMITQNVPWTHEMRHEIGDRLLTLLVPGAMVPPARRQKLSPQPAMHLETSTGKVKHKLQRHIKPTQWLIEYLARSSKEAGDLSLVDARYMPMLIPPRPWLRYDTGGLMTCRHYVVRGYDMQYEREWIQAAEAQGLFKTLYRALNVLGSTRWRVNNRVLDVMLRIKDDPNYVGTLRIPAYEPFEMPHIRVPTPYLRMAREGYNEGQMLFTAGKLLPRELYHYVQERQRVREANVNSQTLRAEFELQLDVAAYLGKKANADFYMPHSIDFRGRAYPVTGYLTHHHDDVARGLLQFGEGKPLGPEGLRWLLIQLANCYGQGKDKLSLEDRYKFGLSRVQACHATAKDPLSHEGSWWQEGDDAWQLLACALEVSAALNAPYPEEYISHQPVFQDGSCNGLQHYAALARDMSGAKAVNVYPADKPQDVYQAVATRVDARVRRDAAANDSIAVKLIEREGGVDRKLVKQTVMTTVYGVTFIGAKDQIASRLRERGWKNETEIGKVAAYLARLTLHCVGDVFVNAEPLKKWLANSASCVAKSGHTVSWMSPVGFPIRQSYYTDAEEGEAEGEGEGCEGDVSTSVGKDNREGGEVQGEEVVDSVVDDRKVNVRGQRTAFPPNYIHSIDAAHMMMTALRCHDAGITFAGIHDSFMTHAGTVDQMSAILREQFVLLHSQPLLEELHAFMSKRVTHGNTLDELPPTGELDLKDVIKSTYFFS